jgi:hypothetical protein
MNMPDCIELVITNNGLGRLAVETITNFARRGGFLAGTIEKLSGDIAERSLWGRTFFAFLGERSLNA